MKIDSNDDVEHLWETNAAWDELYELRKALVRVPPQNQRVVDQVLDRVNTLNRKIQETNPTINKSE